MSIFCHILSHPSARRAPLNSTKNPISSVICIKYQYLLHSYLPHIGNRPIVTVNVNAQTALPKIDQKMQQEHQQQMLPPELHNEWILFIPFSSVQLLFLTVSSWLDLLLLPHYRVISKVGSINYPISFIHNLNLKNLKREYCRYNDKIF